MESKCTADRLSAHFASDAQQAATRLRELLDAWRKVVSRYPWDHLGHFTFPWEIADPLTAFRLYQAYADSLTREAQQPVPWFAVAELTHTGRVHLHALLRGTAGISLDRLVHRWEGRNGNALVKVFDPHLHGHWYVVKHIPAERAEWRFSDGFARAMQKLDRFAARRSDS